MVQTAFWPETRPAADDSGEGSSGRTHAARHPFPSRGQPPHGALEHVRVACKALGIEVEQRDYATGRAGCVERVTGLAYEYSLRLNSKHTDART